VHKTQERRSSVLFMRDDYSTNWIQTVRLFQTARQFVYADYIYSVSVNVFF
jgi:hypothetical protein